MRLMLFINLWRTKYSCVKIKPTPKRIRLRSENTRSADPKGIASSQNRGCGECVDRCAEIVGERRGQKTERMPKIVIAAKAWATKAIGKR